MTHAKRRVGWTEQDHRVFDIMRTWMGKGAFIGCGKTKVGRRFFLKHWQVKHKSKEEVDSVVELLRQAGANVFTILPMFPGKEQKTAMSVLVPNEVIE